MRMIKNTISMAYDWLSRKTSQLIPARRPAEHYTPRIIPYFDGAAVPLETSHICGMNRNQAEENYHEKDWHFNKWR